MKADLCEVIVVLDRSGSMSSIADDMMGGFDKFMEQQRAVPGECRVSLYQFDSEYQIVYEDRPVADVPKCHLVPRGSTALVDAVGRTINSVGERLKNAPDENRPSKVVFLVITDGHENASSEFTAAKVREMVEHQTKAYQWQFVYLGADAQAFDDGAKIGMMNAAQYTPTSAGTRKLYDQVSASVTSYRSGVTSSLSVPKDVR